MKKLLTLTIIVLTGITLLSACGKGKAQDKAEEVGLNLSGTETVVHTFYDWFTSYGGNAYVSGAYSESALLTNELIEKIDKQLTESQGLIAQNPFTCTKNVPDNFVVNDSTEANEVIMTEYFGNEGIEVKVKLQNSQISEIICLEE